MRKASWGGKGKEHLELNDQMNKTNQSLWSFYNQMFVNC